MKSTKSSLKLKVVEMVSGDWIGINKHWVINDKNDYDKLCDYYQKINYSVQDLNNELDNLEIINMKSIIYITVLMDWIWEASESIKRLVRKDVKKSYLYNEAAEWKRAKAYHKAFRSYVVAHPLTTDRHKQYGLDGSFICVDIRPTSNVVSLPFCPEELFYRLTFMGMQNHKKELADDFCLMSYSSADNMQYFKYITCNIKDLEKTTQICLDELKAFEKYISKQKRKDYV